MNRLWLQLVVVRLSTETDKVTVMADLTWSGSRWLHNPCATWCQNMWPFFLISMIPGTVCDYYIVLAFWDIFITIMYLNRIIWGWPVRLSQQTMRIYQLVNFIFWKMLQMLQRFYLKKMNRNTKPNNKHDGYETDKIITYSLP